MTWLLIALATGQCDGSHHNHLIWPHNSKIKMPTRDDISTGLRCTLLS
jgi:hypothetical protein